MEYTVIFNHKSYDLPKKTLKIWEDLEVILKLDSTNLSNREKYKQILKFIDELLGHDNFLEIFGTDKIEEMDLNELALAVFKVRDAYNLPLSDYQAERTKNEISQLPLEQLSSAAKIIESASKVKK